MTSNSLMQIQFSTMLLLLLLFTWVFLRLWYCGVGVTVHWRFGVFSISQSDLWPQLVAWRKGGGVVGREWKTYIRGQTDAVSITPYSAFSLPLPLSAFSCISLLSPLHMPSLSLSLFHSLTCSLFHCLSSTLSFSPPLTHSLTVFKTFSQSNWSPLCLT